MKVPFGPLPELVNGTKGGLNACTKDGPGSAPVGSENSNWVELTKNSGILGVPSRLNPPRLTTPLACLLKKLITVSLENPVPCMVILPPTCLMDVIAILCPIGTETALLFL